MKLFDFLAPAVGDVIDGFRDQERIYALDQMDTYNPLRTLLTQKGNGAVVRYELTAEQRQMVSEGADVLLELLHFGGPLAPSRMMLLNQHKSVLTAFADDFPPAGDAWQNWVAACLQIEAPYRGGGPAHQWHKFDSADASTWPGRDADFVVVYLNFKNEPRQAVTLWQGSTWCFNAPNYAITHWRELEWPKE